MSPFTTPGRAFAATPKTPKGTRPRKSVCANCVPYGPPNTRSCRNGAVPGSRGGFPRDSAGSSRSRSHSRAAAGQFACGCSVLFTHTHPTCVTRPICLWLLYICPHTKTYAFPTAVDGLAAAGFNSHVLKKGFFFFLQKFCRPSHPQGSLLSRSCFLSLHVFSSTPNLLFYLSDLLLPHQSSHIPHSVKFSAPSEVLVVTVSAVPALLEEAASRPVCLLSQCGRVGAQSGEGDSTAGTGLIRRSGAPDVCLFWRSPSSPYLPFCHGSVYQPHLRGNWSLKRREIR
ncbi:hypothetical protein J6590_006655 [Homalodisca vitripennis]|nr:hypothetical protein J6590_006655 [Homalodisca vitripennis]